ncbi:MAG: LysE family translocator [Gammaproteobacteria bacterium]|nr:MAG: LysE family translocator [Gammaproteobacteria bacterium]
MSLIIAMSLFALSMSVSPGPVNLVTFSSGLNYGFMRSLPFVAGAALGFTLLLVVVGLGLGEIIALSPVLMQVLAYTGTAFICYMGYKIATAHPELPGASERQPHFFQGAALQWLNPKAWIASLSGVSAFEATLGNGLFIFASLYLVICFFSIAVWAFAGARVSGLLYDRSNLQWCNRIMGGLLVIVAIYLLYLHI